MFRFSDVVLHYSGDVKDDLFHGYGCATYADGTTYEGEFKYGVFDGYGVLMNDIVSEIILTVANNFFNHH